MFFQNKLFQGFFLEKICTVNLTEILGFLTKNDKFAYKSFDYVKNTLHLYTSSTK